VEANGVLNWQNDVNNKGMTDGQVIDDNETEVTKSCFQVEKGI
jgi:hypothetical protein